MNARRSETMQAKCSCCPYGFHVARDFINFSDSLYSSDSLNNLHKINRDAKPRRQSFDKHFSEPPSLDSSREHTTSPQLIPRVPARRGRYKTETEVYLHVPQVNGIPVADNASISNSHPILIREEESNDELTADKLILLWSNFLPSNDLNTSESHNPALRRLKQQMAAAISRMKQLEQDSNSLSTLRQKCQMLQEENRQLSSQPRRKALHSRSIGVGSDQPEWNLSLNDRFNNSTNQRRTIETESHSDERVRVKEKEIHTILTGKCYTMPETKDRIPKTTRSVAVETDRTDDDSQIRIHEKELRTVLIGEKLGGGGQTVQRRNVGVLCKSAMRDVGVSYMCDWKADTRTVGVGVGEQLGQILEGKLDLSELTMPDDHLGTSTSYTTIQQTNLAAFYSKVVNINYDAFRNMLEEKFKKNVRTVAIQVKAVETCDRGINHKSSGNCVSTGVGNDSIQVRVQPIVKTRSVGLSICPSTRNSVVQTGTRFLLDSSTNTPRALGVDKGTNPFPPESYPASTNTDIIRHLSASVQTEVKSAKNSSLFRHSSCNTDRRYLVNKSSNTDKNYESDKSKSGPSPLSSLLKPPPSQPLRKKSMLDKAIITDKVRMYNAATATIMPTTSRGCSTDRKVFHNSSTNTIRIHTYDKHSSVLPENFDKKQKSLPTKVREQAVQVNFIEVEEEEEDEDEEEDDDEEIEEDEEELEEDAEDDDEQEEDEEEVYEEDELEVGEEVYSNMAPDVQYGEEESSLQNLMDDFEELEKKTEDVFLSNLTTRNVNRGNNKTRLEKADENTEDEEERQIKVRQRVDRLDVYSGTPDDTGDEFTVQQEHQPSSSSSSAALRNSALKSIMKNAGLRSEPRNKAIKFAEKLIEQEDKNCSSKDDNQDHFSDSDSSYASQTSTSYDEASYDGRMGKVEYVRKIDTTDITDEDSSAHITDQNFRDVYELSKAAKDACDTYSIWLADPTEVTTKDKSEATSKLQKEWFSISSHKTSEVTQVEDLLNSVAEISKDLLKIVVNLTDDNGNTALHYSISHGNVDIVSLLLDTDLCDVDKPNRAGYTPLMLAALAQLQTPKHKDVVSKLMEVGDVNAKSTQAGQTALMLAVSHDRIDTVKLLLDAGANINEQDDDGSTALMCASEHGYIDIVKLLLNQRNCDILATDNDGSSALSIAMEADHKDVGVLLYAHMQSKPLSSQLSGSGKKISRSSSLVSSFLAPNTSNLSKNSARSVDNVPLTDTITTTTTHIRSPFISAKKTSRQVHNISGGLHPRQTKTFLRR
ncbi:DgyrCDS4100 [Dimorphilus gyrociliatus]|uniref:DgyrCDS4100 n=1 Tax=Dimorphilus gyrociliatus TaxID=2664684 RepID=A0A7I8VFE5_9ANNE|nr:DgyrCDS4100 [Dimorphilus gyrociliatus]